MSREALCSTCQPTEECSFDKAFQQLADKYALAVEKAPDKKNPGTIAQNMNKKMSVNLRKASRRGCPKAININIKSLITS